MDILFIIIGLCLFIRYLSIVGRTKKWLRNALINTFSGVASLVLCSAITNLFFEKTLCLSPVTAFISAVLGIPGTLLLMITGFAL